MQFVLLFEQSQENGKLGDSDLDVVWSKCKFERRICVGFFDLQTCQSESKKFRMIGRLKVPDSQIVRKAKSDIYLSGTGGGGLLI